MELRIRDYRPGDAREVVEIFRDSYNTLRESKGGLHPDEEVDEVLALPDEAILDRLTQSSLLVVAEIVETGELAGTGAIRDGLAHRLVGSTFSMNHYVPERFQKGRADVSVGSALRKATIEKARQLGYRKLCGLAVPESKGFHAKFGAVFFPEHNASDWHSGVEYQYYEFVFRESPLNAIKFESYAARLVKLAKNLRRSVMSLF